MALPVNGSTRLIPAYYSFYRPRKDERLSWPSWLTYSGWLTHITGHPSAAGRAQDRESSPARDRRSTTVPPYAKHLAVVRCSCAFAELTSRTTAVDVRRVGVVGRSLDLDRWLPGTGSGNGRKVT